MTIGLLTAELFLPSSHSLKEKRQVVRSLVQRLQNRFNVAVAQTDEHDLWARATLAIVTISSDAGHVSRVLNRVMEHIETHNGARVLSFNVELL